MFGQKFRRFCSANSSGFWIVLSFIVWIFVFRNFLNSKLALINDALSYYEHIKFFVENLKKGIFPLWDPFWLHGASNDFFLRRIGAYNPFYGFIALFESLGFSYTLSYLWFLALYYFGGMVAFYLLAMRLYNNRLIAYGGYLILMFSALGTRLFDSYMMLITVPLLWFFYFLIAFSQTPRLNFFFGFCLSFMILMNTYIPFYFVSFLILFLILFTFLYIKEIPNLLGKYGSFFKKHTVAVILSLAIILLSFVPLLTFFYSSSKGQFVMPARHAGSDTQQTLTVSHKTLEWGAVEDLLFSYYFSDLRTYKFAIVYVPFFAFIVLMLGVFCKIRRQTALIFLSGFMLFCCIVPFGLPFYDFLYKHIFFLKYFRNLHFFIWFMLIPLVVLLSLEHWRNFMDHKAAHKKWLLLYVAIVHSAVFVFVFHRLDSVLSTYIMIGFSFIFWTLLVLDKIKNDFWKYALLTLIVVIQPMEAYSNLSARALKWVPDMYGYSFSFQKPNFKLPDIGPETASLNQKPELYYLNKNISTLNDNLSPYAVSTYLVHLFDFVDQIEPFSSKSFDSNVLERIFRNNENRAVVFTKDSEQIKLQGTNPQSDRHALNINQENEQFKVLSFNANSIKLLINMPYEKFLIYKDGFDENWRATVNGHKVRLYQTNVAFKGVWVPAGKSIVEFHYGHWLQYLLNYVLLGAAFVFLFLFLRYSKGQD